MSNKLDTKVGIDLSIAAGGAAASASESYSAPALIEVGSTVELVQGGGGMSGTDCRYYRIFTGSGGGC